MDMIWAAMFGWYLIIGCLATLLAEGSFTLGGTRVSSQGPFGQALSVLLVFLAGYAIVIGFFIARMTSKEKAKEKKWNS